VQENHVSPRSVRAFEPRLGERAIWNIKSTATGGGVAEMLRYARHMKVDVRWLVMEAPPAFFRLTKRIHNALHGSHGDGSALGAEQSALYTRVAHENAAALRTLVKPGDVDLSRPQVAGSIPRLLQREAHVIWRCHIRHEQLDNSAVGSFCGRTCSTCR
jgi:trehalose synthase